MSNARLPERPSLEYLKKLAKDRLEELRLADPRAKLSTALLHVAREHGFSSWRALKEEVERRRAKTAGRFFEAAANGDLDTLRMLLAGDRDLVRAEDPSRPHHRWIALHTASERGQLAAVRLLL